MDKETKETLIIMGVLLLGLFIWWVGVQDGLEASYQHNQQERE